MKTINSFEQLRSAAANLNTLTIFQEVNQKKLIHSIDSRTGKYKKEVISLLDGIAESNNERFFVLIPKKAKDSWDTHFMHNSKYKKVRTYNETLFFIKEEFEQYSNLIERIFNGQGGSYGLEKNFYQEGQWVGTRCSGNVFYYNKILVFGEGTYTDPKWFIRQKMEESEMNLLKRCWPILVTVSPFWGKINTGYDCCGRPNTIHWKIGNKTEIVNTVGGLLVHRMFYGASDLFSKEKNFYSYHLTRYNSASKFNPSWLQLLGIEFEIETCEGKGEPFRC